jgi:hypothetical protein
MARDTRRNIIEKIEQKRGSKLLTYVTSDRPPSPGQIGDDAVRPMYEHLRAIGKTDKLDMFIYSRGGAIDVPWRINTALRATSKQWASLIPFRANSAATLLSIGADEIVLGRHGELGPIDPIMTLQRLMPGSGKGTIVQDVVPVEDIMAYVKFIQERAGLSDQEALSTALTKLTDRMDAVSLGSAYRTHSHIRDVARRMLLSRNQPTNEQTISTIVETLAERVYAHGHAIGLRAAVEIGLPTVEADPELDALLWELLLEYEKHMKLLEPLDAAAVVATADKYSEEGIIAMIESLALVHEFAGRIDITAKRQVPQNMNIALNLNLQTPPALLAALQAGGVTPQVLQQIAQQLNQEILQIAQQAVQNAMKEQAPLVGIEAAFRDGKWRSP